MSWLKAPTRPAPRLRDYANLIHILKLTGRVRCGEPSPPFQKTADARKHVLRLVRGKRLKRRAVPCGRGAVAEEILKLLAPPRRRHQLGDEMAAALVGEHARQVIGHVGSLSQGHAVRSSLRYHSPESLCADRSHQSRGMVGTAVAVRGELHRQRSKSMYPDRGRQVGITRTTSDSRLPSACHAGGLRGTMAQHSQHRAARANLRSPQRAVLVAAVFTAKTRARGRIVSDECLRMAIPKSGHCGRPGSTCTCGCRRRRSMLRQCLLE